MLQAIHPFEASPSARQAALPFLRGPNPGGLARSSLNVSCRALLRGSKWGTPWLQHGMQLLQVAWIRVLGLGVLSSLWI